jgi:Arc/MetJ family transcription regulator
MRRTDADGYADVMSTVRATVTVNAELLEKAQREVPGETTSALVELALRALLAQRAGWRLAEAGGKYPNARMPRRRRFGHGAR